LEMLALPARRHAPTAHPIAETRFPLYGREVDDGDQLFHDHVTEAPKLRRQFFCWVAAASKIYAVPPRCVSANPSTQKLMKKPSTEWPGLESFGCISSLVAVSFEYILRPNALHWLVELRADRNMNRAAITFAIFSGNVSYRFHNHRRRLAAYEL
jgi:hypothetical protein